MRYNPGDILTFSNGMIGCVTDSFKLAMVNKQGMHARPGDYPLLSEYLLSNTVVKHEQPAYKTREF